MNLTSLSDIQVAELNTRLLAIDVVSWQWNNKGLAIHVSEGRLHKLKNDPEIGVLAQNARDALHDFFPHIISYHQTGALMVNYSLLVELSNIVLQYLDKRYLLLDTKKHLPGKTLDLSKLLHKYYTKDVQILAARLLTLVKLYNQKITDMQFSQEEHDVTTRNGNDQQA
jgi:hypothetical protein